MSIVYKSTERENEAMMKVTYACNYNFATDTEETAVTEITVPAENDDEALERLAAILGGKSRYEKLKSRIFLQDRRKYD